MGTERVRTLNGNVEGTYASLPFGDAFTPSGSDNDPYHFAQLDHDAETDTSHAQFRQYSSTEGRWMSPDPYSGSYDPTNPQSFNRYAYVMNNPLNYVDPSGLECTLPDGTLLFDYELGGDGVGASTACYEHGGSYTPPYINNYQVDPDSSVSTISPPQLGPFLPNPIGSMGGAGGGGSAGGSGGGGGASSAAPNNIFSKAFAYEKKVVSCNFQAEWAVARQDGVALGLDAVGFIPGEGTAAAVAQYGIATASFFNSAYHGDSTGTKLGMAGGLTAIVSGVQSTMPPAAWAKAIPIVGYIANTAASINDATSAYKHGSQAYNSCMSVP